MKDETLKQAEQLLHEYLLCDSCFGRLFRKEIKDGTNSQKGQSIRKQLHYKERTETHDCWLCEGLIDEIPHFTKIIADTVKDYEFETFLVGSKIDEDIQEKEQRLWKHLKLEDA